MNHKSQSRKINMFDRIPTLAGVVIVTAVITHIVTNLLGGTDELKEKFEGFEKKVIELNEKYNAFVNLQEEIGHMRKSVDESQERLDRIETASFYVKLDIPQNYIRDSDANPIEVSGHIIDIDLEMRNGSDKSSSGYWVHIFQIESGVGVAYYYQGSSLFLNEQNVTIPVYLGKDEEDINKSYQIVAIVNGEQPYQKADDVKTFSNLPGDPKAVLMVKRVQ